MARALDLDELVDHWTLPDDERELIAGKRGPTRLGFALLRIEHPAAGRVDRILRSALHQAEPEPARREARVAGTGHLLGVLHHEEPGHGPEKGPPKRALHS